MIRNLILSLIIGILATYLPVWRWSDTLAQITGAAGIGMFAFYVLMATERTDGENDKKKSKRYI